MDVPILKRSDYIIAAFFFSSLSYFAQTDIPDQNERKTKYILYNQELDKSQSDGEKAKKAYYKSGKLAEIYYPDSLKMGFYENGKTRFVTRFRNGRMKGERIYYYSNGQVEMMVNYRKGMQDGPFVLYYENGKIKYKGEFKGDHISGERFCYDEKGNLINGDFTFYGYENTKYEGKAIMGKPEGEMKVSDQTGLIMTVNFKNGEAHGLAYHYLNGKKIKAENYAEGIYVDDAPVGGEFNSEN